MYNFQVKRRHCHSSNRKSSLVMLSRKVRRSTSLVVVADSRCGVGDVRGVRSVCERSRMSCIGDRSYGCGVGERSCVRDRGGRVDDGCRMRRVRDGCSGDHGSGCQEAGSRRSGDTGDKKSDKNGALVHDDEVEEVVETDLALLRGLSELLLDYDTKIRSGPIFIGIEPFLRGRKLVLCRSHPRRDLQVAGTPHAHGPRSSGFSKISSYKRLRLLWARGLGCETKCDGFNCSDDG